jgi:NAD(P)-dependent dehydrogenase (short-subunit alcohol dehydrogenase family)
LGTIAVSGSASGIGAATATRLQQAGHTVIGVDRHDADVIADLASVEGREAAVEGVLARCDGRLDGLVTAAGVSLPSSPDLIVSVNFFGTIALMHGLREALTASGRGRAVAVSSVLARLRPGSGNVVNACLQEDEALAHQRMAAEHLDEPSGPAYVATKVAVARWVRRHAPTPLWAGAGIRLNAIAPGAVATPMLLPNVSTPADGVPPNAPTGRFGRPDEIAAWIEQMLGEYADFMCGSVVFVDGGMDAKYRPDDWPAPPRVVAKQPADGSGAPSRLSALRRRLWAAK